MVRVAVLSAHAAEVGDVCVRSCLSSIDRLSTDAPVQVFVTPELPWPETHSDDGASTPEAELSDDCALLSTLRERAVQRAMHLVVTVALREADGLKRLASLVYGPDGSRLAKVEQTLGDESPTRSNEALAVVATSVGRIGVLACEDLLSMEACRHLALHGAELICAATGGPYGARATLRAKARAGENGVVVALAGRSRAPGAEDEGSDAEAYENLVVGADGCVLATRGAPAGLGAIVTVELDLTPSEERQRVDGGALFALRRPDLYRPLALRPRGRDRSRSDSELDVAVVSPCPADDLDALLESTAQTVQALAVDGAQLIVLPELFCLPTGSVSSLARGTARFDDDPRELSVRFVSIVRRVAEACARTATHVVTSLVEQSGRDFFHMGLVIGQAGVVARQPQVHVPRRHAWARAGHRFESIPLPWGRLSILVGEDASVPESLGLVALSSADLVAVPFAAQDRWELDSSLVARAEECALSLAVATRHTEFGSSLLVDVHAGDEPSVVRAVEEEGVLRARLRLRTDPERAVAGAGRAAYWAAGDLAKRGLGVPAVPASHGAHPGDHDDYASREGDDLPPPLDASVSAHAECTDEAAPDGEHEAGPRGSVGDEPARDPADRDESSRESTETQAANEQTRVEANDTQVEAARHEGDSLAQDSEGAGEGEGKLETEPV